MKQIQKGSALIVILIVIAILAVAGFLLLKNKNANLLSHPNLPAQSNTADQSIKSDSDLTNAQKDLDNTDVDGAIDPELNQNDTEVKSFAPRIRLKNGTSTNWSGYAAQTSLSSPQNNAVSDVKGSWVVPAVTCTSTNTYSSAWVGIDGYSDNSVEQTGTEHDCIGGKPVYSAWYEIYPKPSFRVNLPVKAGDNISAEVKYVANNQFRLTLTNTTTGQTFTTNQKAKAQRQSAEWIMEAPWSGGVLPLSNFGTISFSNANATINGHTGSINDSTWQNDKITMTNESGTPKATPSDLSNGGSSFNVAWNSN